MKTNPPLRIFKPTVAAALAIVIVWGLSFPPAQANSYVVTLEQVGSNVVATGSGAIDLTGLSFFVGPILESSGMQPVSGIIVTGSTGTGSLYVGPISGPTNFGGGSVDSADSGIGDVVGMFFAPPIPGLIVRTGYVSGQPLSDSAAYNNATFSSLGVTPGTYVWSWGTGADQKFTLKIGAAGVPDSGSTFGLLFLALIALFGANRLRSFRLG
jgi:hypothetical protein